MQSKMRCRLTPRRCSRSALDLPLTAAEAGAGLVPPAAATYLLGKGGSILIILMLFMAVTSSGSAELIAVSSLFTYDVYRCAPSLRPSGLLYVQHMDCKGSLEPSAGCTLCWMLAWLWNRGFVQPAAGRISRLYMAAVWLLPRRHEAGR